MDRRRLAHEIQIEGVRRTCDDAHRALMDFGTEHQKAIARGVVNAFECAGLLSRSEAHVRRLAMAVCPGHNDSRVWCAYCGDIKSDIG